MILTALIFIMGTKMMAQQVTFNEAEPFLKVFQEKIEIPDGYHFSSVKKVMANDVSSYLFRYQKDGNKGKKGEYFSFIISEKEKRILGFTNMDRKYANLQMLSKEQTAAIAKDFLVEIDSELAAELKNLWIERHDEHILVTGEKGITVAGMKYKCYRLIKDDYAWVIVGFDGSIITFERNIKWNNDAQKRITEKWLHDSWVSE